jgi:two-component system, OmpR family, phosphate regulon sensor histidine kinase PhoR
MSKNKIRIIISLMALSSLALMAFQMYWIGHISRANNEVFGANVREAMQQVVRKLEKQELIYITQKKTLEDGKRKELLAMSRATNTHKPPFKKEIKKYPKVLAYNNIDALQPNVHSDVLNMDAIQIFGKNLPLNEITFQLNVDNPSIADVEAINQFNNFVNGQMEDWVKVQEFDDTINDSLYKIENKSNKVHRKAKQKLKKFPIKTISKSKEQFDKIVQKSELMKDVFGDFLLKERPISDRINRIGLDSMLHYEIEQRGINIPLEYGIALNKDTSALHFVSSPNINLQKQKIIKSQGFSASLFPNDLYNSGNQLFVYFPDKERFILSKMWMNILGSIVMLGIVLSCFYIAVNTILKQKKLAEIKNDFINNMTHEFKTPISTISLACEVLNDKDMGANPSVVSRYLGIINDENKRLGTQVEKVLQTALLDKGEVKLKMAELNLHETINKVVENISPQIEMKGGKINLNLNAENNIINADQVHITNIIFNLLDNAIKYSKNNPEISLESENIENGVKISIADNGIGMSAEEQKNIFEKFYRVPTGNLHDVKGFGLGLSYVKKMVEEHHGSIKVKSKIGEGSTFDVFLPQI